MLINVLRALFQQIVSMGRDLKKAMHTFASVLVAALVIFFNPVGMSFRTTREKVQESPDETLASKLRELSEAMSRSSCLVAEVENTLHAKQALVEQLKSEAATATTLASLSQEQRDAVANQLRSEVDKGGRKALWLGVLVNLVFFGLGVFISTLF
jgi:conjugal transfer/entry exclusion protein